MTTINKYIKMLLALLSYAVIMVIVYNFTDILQQDNSFEQLLFLIVITTVYSYIMSSIDKGTFRFKFSFFGMALYIVGVVGYILCSDKDAPYILSFAATALLIAGVINQNG